MQTTLIDAADAARHILRILEHGGRVVSVLATDSGSRMLVVDDGSAIGTLGSADLDSSARQLAAEVFATGVAQLRANLFAELHAPAEQLIIFGAGHIALPLSEMGVKLGFNVTVLDDREEFAIRERFDARVRVLRLDLESPLTGLNIDSATYVVLVTRAHKHDFALLRALLAAPARPRYAGMIGSRRRVRAAFHALLAGGVAREELQHVHAPVGLDIGAETPAEIAVSIAAELIRERRGGSGKTISGDERVLDRFFSEPS